MRVLILSRFLKTIHIASKSPGNERLNRSRGWLCQRVLRLTGPVLLLPHLITGHFALVVSLTVSHVLKYSRNWVMSPSLRVHTWTQYAWAPSQPSAMMQAGPTAVTPLGSNLNAADAGVHSPVRRRIMCWHRGGPWNHHSRSPASSPDKASVSPRDSASYSVRTTAVFVRIIVSSGFGSSEGSTA